MGQAMDLYKTPFKKAKYYLRRLYLDLSFIEDLGLDPVNLNIKAVYTATSLAPVLIVDDKLKVNNYIFLGSTLEAEKAGVSIVPPINCLMIGYKHFDKWKFEDGIQIGDFQSETAPKKVLKLQRLIQRKVLGFWRYWTLRVMKKI
jgi:hypothetical protein